MIVYERFKVYQLYSEQSSLCFLCNNEMNIHDMEVENIIDDGLICVECFEKKKQITSDFYNCDSLIDYDIRPLKMFCNNKFIVGPDLSYVDEAYEQEEIEDEIDPEEKIQNSWYHRAILGDENREIYDDGQDTDFEAVQALWEEIHADEEDEEFQQNMHFLDLN